jgi:hypothetical protein
MKRHGDSVNPLKWSLNEERGSGMPHKRPTTTTGAPWCPVLFAETLE